MSRQHTAPILLTPGEPDLVLTQTQNVSEEDIQQLIHEHPSILPLAEIDDTFSGAVSICRELSTPSGPIDNFLVTPKGHPVLVECKLWRNPQARREVVGQALDYAKELTKWTSADIEREAARRGVKLFDCVRTSHPDANEAEFHDALSRNLRLGRCLLVVVGDGIREGVESIFEHLRTQSLLHFSFGLVEIPRFQLPDGRSIATPRIVARSAVDVRQVIQLPDGMEIGPGSDEDDGQVDPESQARGDERQEFWREFLAKLKLDDPEQPLPARPPRQGFLALSMPPSGSAVWITVYRDTRQGEVGLFLSFTRSSEGERTVGALAEHWDDLRPKLGGHAQLADVKGKPRILERRKFGDLSDPATRSRAFDWLADRTNVFVNVLRPAIRGIVADLQNR